MAHEGVSQEERKRLQERYHAMSDGELLGLAEGIGNLTEVAGDALRRELRERRLQDAGAGGKSEASGFPMVAAGPGHPSSPSLIPRDDEDVGRGAVVLTIFYDAIDAGRACDFLDEREIDFEMQDVSQPRSGLGMLEGTPPVALRLVVKRTEQPRAMAVLREKMGLFPLQEVEVADELVDDGTVTALGSFAQREDAEEAARILEEAGFWCRVVKNEDGSVEDESAYTLEVREVDVFAAGEVLDRAME